MSSRWVRGVTSYPSICSHFDRVNTQHELFAFECWSCAVLCQPMHRLFYRLLHRLLQCLLLRHLIADFALPCVRQRWCIHCLCATYRLRCVHFINYALLRALIFPILASNTTDPGNYQQSINHSIMNRQWCQLRQSPIINYESIMGKMMPLWIINPAFCATASMRVMQKQELPSSMLVPSQL
jgi:hypothetical protein